jgi:hypothetical protein
MAPPSSGWWPVLGTHAAFALFAVALASVALVASNHASVTATGLEHRQAATDSEPQAVLLARAQESTRQRQQQQAAVQRALALQNRRSIPSSAINVMGSPFISTPVGLQPSAADIARDAAVAASLARSQAPCLYITMLHGSAN